MDIKEFVACIREIYNRAYDFLLFLKCTSGFTPSCPHFR